MQKTGALSAGWAMALVACSSAAPDTGLVDAGPARVEPGDAAATAVEAGRVGDAGARDAGSAAAIDGAVTAPEAGTGTPPCADLALCDDFEKDAPGAMPAGWKVTMGCNPNTQDTAANGEGLLVGVDSSQHHSGQNALRVVGGDSCGYYAVASAPFAQLGTQLYARLWVRFSGGPTANHNGFLSMATTGGDHLRLGFQDEVVAWNAQSSDATLPDMDPQGTSTSVAPAAAAWSCLEFHLDESSGHVELWWNGQAVSGLSYDGGAVQGVDDQWARGAPSPPVPVSLGLGWLGLNDQQTVWFDDVALGGARVGCD